MRMIEIDIDTEKEFREYCKKINAKVYDYKDLEREYNNFRDGIWDDDEFEKFVDEEFVEVRINTGKLFIIESWLKPELLEDLLSEEEDN